jgi:hypothetical protein
MYSPSDYSISRTLVKEQVAFFNSAQTNSPISGPSDSTPIVNQQNSSNSIIDVISLGLIYIVARPLVMPMWLIDISKRLQPEIIVS